MTRAGHHRLAALIACALAVLVSTATALATGTTGTTGTAIALTGATGITGATGATTNVSSVQVTGSLPPGVRRALAQGSASISVATGPSGTSITIVHGGGVSGPTTATTGPTVTGVTTTTTGPAGAGAAGGGGSGTPVAAILLAILGGLLVAGSLAWGLIYWRGWDPHWLAAMGHSLREASYHLGATFAELGDWLRYGR
jgi:hypothetical protein